MERKGNAEFIPRADAAEFIKQADGFATVEVVAEIHMRVMSQSIMTRCPMADSEFVALSFE